MRILLLFILTCLCLQTKESDAQLINMRRRMGVSGYSKSSNGYFYRGREYIRGVDLPSNMNCRCPMCTDLKNAYYAAQSQAQTDIPLGISVIPDNESASTKLIGTPKDKIKELIDVFEIKIGDDFTLFDPGCGDARLLIYAAQNYGAKGVGFEINPETHKIAIENVKKEGLEDMIEIRLGDSRDSSFEEADGVVMFLFPELIEDLTTKFKELKSGTKVVSYSHDIPLPFSMNFNDVYVWEK